MEGLESKLRKILKESGISISNVYLRKLVREYNNYQNPISDCIYQITQSPEDFLGFIQTKLNQTIEENE